ncbi:MAG: DUF4242 domain-containing protein [Burkholderiales bacterium]
MKRYLIEREIPGVGALNASQRKAAAAQSNAALAKLDGRAKWIESYVAGDKTFCLYLADDEGAVHEHARISGFPANRVTEIVGTLDPAAAN